MVCSPRVAQRRKVVERWLRRKRGATYQLVARECGVSPQFVRKWVQRWEQGLPLEQEAPRSGRPRTLEHMSSALNAATKRKEVNTAAKVKGHLGLQCSVRTVRRQLNRICKHTSAQRGCVGSRRRIWQHDTPLRPGSDVKASGNAWCSRTAPTFMQTKGSADGLTGRRYTCKSSGDTPYVYMPMPESVAMARSHSSSLQEPLVKNLRPRHCVPIPKPRVCVHLSTWSGWGSTWCHTLTDCLLTATPTNGFYFKMVPSLTRRGQHNAFCKIFYPGVCTSGWPTRRISTQLRIAGSW